MRAVAGSAARTQRTRPAELRGGERPDGTTRRRPVEVFAAEEAPCLLQGPEAPYAVPAYGTAIESRGSGLPGPERQGAGRAWRLLHRWTTKP